MVSSDDWIAHSWGVCIGNTMPANGQPLTLITITWDRDVPVSEIRRLSSAWAATISEKPVVKQTHVATRETVRGFIIGSTRLHDPLPFAGEPASEPGFGPAATSVCGTISGSVYAEEWVRQRWPDLKVCAR
jgi:hypothetical protein